VTEVDGNVLWRERMGLRLSISSLVEMMKFEKGEMLILMQ